MPSDARATMSSGNRKGAGMRASLSGRFGVGRASDVGGGFADGLVGGGSARAPRLPGAAVHPAIGALALALAAAALAILRGGLGGGEPTSGASVSPSVTFEGVSYQLLHVGVTRSIPQRGGRRITASGTFEIVKLRLSAADGRAHRISTDLLTIKGGLNYYGVSSPDDLGLTDRQWGVIGGSTAVPGDGAINVKAVFDVPTRVTRNPVLLHIGRFGYVGGEPAQTLRLPDRAACCRASSSARAPARAPATRAPSAASAGLVPARSSSPASESASAREHASVAPLRPSPVLG